MRARRQVVASIDHDQFTLLARISTKPVDPSAVIEIGGQAGGGVADTRRPAVIARRVCVYDMVMLASGLLPLPSRFAGVMVSVPPEACTVSEKVAVSEPPVLVAVMV